MTRTEIINELIAYLGFSSYLEIGLASGKNFKQINCADKTGVDPANSLGRFMTSDEFFQKNNRSFDLIFIDGLHHEDQVSRDIDNSLACLNKGGIIVVHDCNPPNELSQKVPRQTSIWTGDVWKAWVKFRRRSDIKQVCIDEDYGCGVIMQGIQEPQFFDLTYEQFVQDKKRYLNLISWQEFKRSYL